MNRWTIGVLVVALLGLCGLGPCLSAATPKALDSPVIPFEVARYAHHFLQPSENATNAHAEWANGLQTYSDGYRSLVSRFQGWLEGILYRIINVLRHMFSGMDTFVTDWINTVRSRLDIPESDRRRRMAPRLVEFINSWKGRGQELSEFLKASMAKMDELIERQTSLRKRRESLVWDGLSTIVTFVTSIPTMLLHPISTISYLMSSAGSAVINEVAYVAWEILKLIWSFVSQVILPPVHSILNQIDNTISLPPFVHIFIQNFNAAYSLGKVLGYVPS